VLSRRPEMVTRFHGVPARPMTIRSSAVLPRCDGLIVVGGGMFGPGLPPLVRMLPAVVAWVRRSGRAVAYVGIGVYPGTPRGTLRRLRQAAERSEITVRDTVSIQTLNARCPIPDVGDLAWQLAPSEPPAAYDVLLRAGADAQRPLLLIAPKAGTTSAQTEELIVALASAVQRWTRSGGAVVALALSSQADHGRDKDMTDVGLVQLIRARTGADIPIVGPNLSPALAKAVTGEAAAVLGLRFHALVFALSMGTNCMGFPWEPKTQALLDEYRLPAFTTIEAMHDWLDRTIPSPITVRR